MVVGGLTTCQFLNLRSDEETLFRQATRVVRELLRLLAIQGNLVTGI